LIARKGALIGVMPPSAPRLGLREKLGLGYKPLVASVAWGDVEIACALGLADTVGFSTGWEMRT
jgi:hypothetical protein